MLTSVWDFVCRCRNSWERVNLRSEEFGGKRDEMDGEVGFGSHHTCDTQPLLKTNFIQFLESSLAELENRSITR